MQNPAMMQNAMQMMQNPQMMQQVMQMRQMMMGGGLGAPGGGSNNLFGAAPAAAGAGDGMTPPPVTDAAPGPMDRMRYASQLQQLVAMGFDDEARSLAALARCQGNVDRALDVLFSQ